MADKHQFTFERLEERIAPSAFSCYDPCAEPDPCHEKPEHPDHPCHPDHPDLCKGNNGVGNGLDPQPPGNPPVNDGPGTSPGNPGNRK